MIPFVKIVIAASVLFIPSVANAAPADGTYRGPVIVKKGLNLSCILTAEISGGGTAVSLTLSGAMCASMFYDQPYAASFTGTTSGTYIIYGVNFDGITSGGCKGNLASTWNGDTISVNNATLPSRSPGYYPCSFIGTLTKID